MDNFTKELMTILDSVKFEGDTLFPTYNYSIEDLKKNGTVTEEVKETEEGTLKTFTYESNDGSERLVSRTFEPKINLNKEEIQKLLDEAVANQDYESAIKYRDMLNY